MLLECFIERYQQDLADGSWPEFEILLTREDDLLWDWLQQPEQAPTASFRTLLEIIRRGPG